MYNDTAKSAVIRLKKSELRSFAFAGPEMSSKLLLQIQLSKYSTVKILKHNTRQAEWRKQNDFPLLQYALVFVSLENNFRKIPVGAKR